MNEELRAAFGEFCSRVSARLHKGAETYGDASLHLPAPKLLDEVQQELEDVAGWSILLWARLQRLKRQAEDDGA